MNAIIKEQSILSGAALAEELEKATDSAAFLTNELRQALHFARNVEGLALLALIGRAATLERDTRNFRDAANRDRTQS